MLRLLDKTGTILNLSDLGLDQGRIGVFNDLIKSPYGIVLVTGPTGSGKTTTLYAALSTINSPEINIITIEDPIEYQIDGIGQIQVNPKIDLTFATGLRSIVRQGPRRDPRGRNPRQGDSGDRDSVFINGPPRLLNPSYQ